MRANRRGLSRHGVVQEACCEEQPRRSQIQGPLILRDGELRCQTSRGNSDSMVWLLMRLLHLKEGAQR